MIKLQIQNIALPLFPLILCYMNGIYYSDNRALLKVLTCWKRTIMFHAKKDIAKNVKIQKII
jgi:hypothetical protein